MKRCVGRYKSASRGEVQIPEPLAGGRSWQDIHEDESKIGRDGT